MKWETVLKLLALAIGLRAVWGWAIDEADDPPMEVWSGSPAVPTAVHDWDSGGVSDWAKWQADHDRYMQRLWVDGL